MAAGSSQEERNVPRASEVKRGDVVEIDRQLYVVREVSVHSPSARGAATLYKMRMTQAATGQKLDQTFKGDDQLTTADLQRRKLQFSYNDGDNVIFMDEEDYTQYGLPAQDIEYERQFIVDGLGAIVGLVVDERLIGIEMPAIVVLEITDCPPALKGGSASARTKPATFVTGLVVQVPDYLEIGDKIKINTAECKFSGRA